jgi:hypothetical protein
VRKRDHSQPACECNLSLCVARLHSQDFGDFDAGSSATATTDFSSAPAPVPLPAVPTPAPTAPGLVPADIMDGPDPTALKLAAADALLHVLPTSAQLQGTGMTGCPTLDQMLSQQVRPPPKECAVSLNVQVHVHAITWFASPSAFIGGTPRGPRLEYVDLADLRVATGRLVVVELCSRAEPSAGTRNAARARYLIYRCRNDASASSSDGSHDVECGPAWLQHVASEHSIRQ